MKTEPFINQPLPEIFFNSRPHKAAWQYLVSGINAREPFLLLYGGYGMGKTTLCLRLTQALKDEGKLPFVFVSTPIQTYSALLARIAKSIGVVVNQNDTPTAVHDSLFKSFEERGQNQRQGLIIIIDDAQEMDISTLNQLRLLANFNIDGFFPIRLLLFSHFSFQEKLKIDLMEPLNQRIKRRHYLQPLDFTETKEYIYFRLVKAGAPGVPCFEEKAIRTIFEFSKGAPRGINNVCDCCLLMGATQGLTVIDDSIVEKAIANIAGNYRKPSEKARTETSVKPKLEPAKESGPTQIILDYPAVDVGKSASDNRKTAEIGSKFKELKFLIFIALIMLIIGVILAVSLDFNQFFKSLFKAVEFMNPRFASAMAGL
jgi:type II secretory pathway predicted ATPase ExeA